MNFEIFAYIFYAFFISNIMQLRWFDLKSLSAPVAIRCCWRDCRLVSRVYLSVIYLQLVIGRVVCHTQYMYRNITQYFLYRFPKCGKTSKLLSSIYMYLCLYGPHTVGIRKHTHLCICHLHIYIYNRIYSHVVTRVIVYQKNEKHT